MRAGTLFLQRGEFIGKDNHMETGPPNPHPPPTGRPAPELIFANWREMLHQLSIGRGLKQAYADVIERYLQVLPGQRAGGGERERARVRVGCLAAGFDA